MENFREWFIKEMGEEGQVQLAFLDSINLESYLKNVVKVATIMEDIEDEYDYGPKRDQIPKELHGCSFNVITEEEFAYYLHERYPQWLWIERDVTWYEMWRK